MAVAVAAAARSAVTFPSLAGPSFPGIRTCVLRIPITDCRDYLRQEITHIDGSAVYIMKPVIRGVFLFTIPAPYPGGIPSFLHNRCSGRLSLEKLSGDQGVTPTGGIGITIRFSKKRRDSESVPVHFEILFLSCEKRKYRFRFYYHSLEQGS